MLKRAQKLAPLADFWPDPYPWPEAQSIRGAVLSLVFLCAVCVYTGLAWSGYARSSQLECDPLSASAGGSGWALQMGCWADYGCNVSYRLASPDSNCARLAGLPARMGPDSTQLFTLCGDGQALTGLAVQYLVNLSNPASWFLRLGVQAVLIDRFDWRPDFGRNRNTVRLPTAGALLTTLIPLAPTSVYDQRKERYRTLTWSLGSGAIDSFENSEFRAASNANPSSDLGYVEAILTLDPFVTRCVVSSPSAALFALGFLGVLAFLFNFFGALKSASTVAIRCCCPRRAATPAPSAGPPCEL